MEVADQPMADVPECGVEVVWGGSAVFVEGPSRPLLSPDTPNSLRSSTSIHRLAGQARVVRRSQEPPLMRTREVEPCMPRNR